MTITFTLSKKDAWRRHWRHWVRFPLRLGLRLSALPVLAFALCTWGGLGPLLSEITALVVGMVPLAALILAGVDLGRKAIGWRREPAPERIAVVGKFDLRWGTPQKDGYYHHWSYFRDIQDVDGTLFFCLNNGNTLQIPKSAFPESEDAERFFQEARRCWERAKMNQKHLSDAQDATVWPPPPRVGPLN